VIVSETTLTIELDDGESASCAGRQTLKSAGVIMRAPWERC
jgi:hypothetical protein